LWAATLARICRVVGGYARPDLPRCGRLRSPGSARIVERRHADATALASRASASVPQPTCWPTQPDPTATALHAEMPGFGCPSVHPPMHPKAAEQRPRPLHDLSSRPMDYEIRPSRRRGKTHLRFPGSRQIRTLLRPQSMHRSGASLMCARGLRLTVVLGDPGVPGPVANMAADERIHRF
jgi:hypothetical protein